MIRPRTRKQIVWRFLGIGLLILTVLLSTAMTLLLHKGERVSIPPPSPTTEILGISSIASPEAVLDPESLPTLPNQPVTHDQVRQLAQTVVSQSIYSSIASPVPIPAMTPSPLPSPAGNTEEYIQNGSFENGLSNWITQGDVTLIHGNDGFASPIDGLSMVRIGRPTDESNPARMNVLSQKISSGVRAVGFYYNFFTYGYRGLEDPGFMVFVNDTMVLQKWASELDSDPAQTATGKLNSSGWKYAAIDLSRYPPGTTLTLAFYAGNDNLNLPSTTSHQTWVYVDGVSTRATIVNAAIPPLPVNDVSVSYEGANQFLLTWTSPHAAAYDIRYSASPITEQTDWFSLPTPINITPDNLPGSGLRAPRPEKEMERYLLQIDPSIFKNQNSKTVFFAIKSLDNAGNMSPISNLASLQLSSPDLLTQPPHNEPTVQIIQTAANVFAFTLSHAQSYSHAEYLLTYQYNNGELQDGLTGTLDIHSNLERKDGLYLGTCSGNLCTPHENIVVGSITLKVTLHGDDIVDKILTQTFQAN